MPNILEKIVAFIKKLLGIRDEAAVPDELVVEPRDFFLQSGYNA